MATYSQIDLFAASYDDFKITNKIRLIEFFGGIGAQSKALEILGADFEHHRLVEWAFPSIIAYNSIHQKDWNDYSKGLSYDEVLSKLQGVSADYNKPMTDKQLRQKGEEWARRVYSCMVATKDYCPDVSRVHAKDLEITERDKYTYILTYSFPCQDLSNAGLCKGMEKGSGTRSGLLWEVERILNECKELDCLPHVLVMENVPGVCGTANLKPWGDWLNALNDLGYTSYFDIINAKDFGIPQNRKRCFMVSILGKKSYHFPKGFKLRYRLKHFLDDKVDESYYLSDELLKRVERYNSYENPLDKVAGKETEASPTITTRVAESLQGGYSASTKLFSNDLEDTTNLRNEFHDESTEIREYKHKEDNSGGGLTETIKIPTANSKGYIDAKEGDGVIHKWKGARGTVQDGMIPTLTTDPDYLGVVVNKKDGKD